jgi:hypothetical protein
MSSKPILISDGLAFKMAVAGIVLFSRIAGADAGLCASRFGWDHVDSARLRRREGVENAGAIVPDA